jgi:hypothetical protein
MLQISININLVNHIASFAKWHAVYITMSRKYDTGPTKPASTTALFMVLTICVGLGHVS